ncbi:MAG: hypothetical protein JSS65_06495 [Armatimonadetes bacterium]|nr:hypothetical protein [Armatimonadota bacterium]
MARKKVATPMLEAFVRDAKVKTFGVMPWWQIIVLAIVPLVVASGVDKLVTIGKLVDLVGLLAGGAILWYFIQKRNTQLANLPLDHKFDYEKWQQVGRVKQILGQGKLTHHIATPVLEELEAAARARFEALEELKTFGNESPELVSQMRNELDEELALAIASSAPVTRRDDQSRSLLKTWEDDQKLMAQVTRRVRARRDRIEAVAQSVSGLEPTGASSLRDALLKARQEREEAEAELNQSLGSL